MPFSPMGEAMQATFCQLCPGILAAKQVVRMPPVGTNQLTSPTSVEPLLGFDDSESG